MSEEGEKVYSAVDGMIAGLLDVQIILAVAICKIANIEPAALAKIFEIVPREELSGRSEEYIANRRYPAEHLIKALAGLPISKTSDVAKRGNARLTLVHGSLRGEDFAGSAECAGDDSDSSSSGGGAQKPNQNAVP